MVATKLDKFYSETFDNFDSFRMETDDGASLFVGIYNKGKPSVVFSHCWTGDHRIWHKVINLIKDKNYTIVVYDQRGHGRSTTGADKPTVKRLGRDLYHIIEKLSLDEIVLCGHSMGGVTIQSLLGLDASVQAKLKKIVLVSTIHRVLEPVKGAIALGTKVLGTSTPDLLITKAFFKKFIIGYAFGKNAQPKDVSLTSECFISTDSRTRGELLSAFGAIDFSQTLKLISVPTNILVGTHDRLTPVKISQAMARHIPNVCLTIIENAGHMLPLERPYEVSQALSLGG